MGRPCTLGESPQGTAVPRGTSTPPLREPPPVAQKADTNLTQGKDPKSFIPALSRSEMTIQDCRNHSRHQRKAKQTIIPDRVAQHNRHLHQTIHHARTLSGGSDGDAAGHLPPIPVQKSQDFSIQSLTIFVFTLKMIAGSSQRPRPQVAAAARYHSCSDHGTRSWAIAVQRGCRNLTCAKLWVFFATALAISLGLALARVGLASA